MILHGSASLAARRWRRLFGALALGLVIAASSVPAYAHQGGGHGGWSHGGGGWGHGGWGHGGWGRGGWGGGGWGYGGWGWGPGWYGYGWGWPYNPYYYNYGSYDPNYYNPGYYGYGAASQAPAVVQNQPVCRQGEWREANGGTVTGTACQGADGAWRMR
jgi:hypothetical protein